MAFAEDVLGMRLMPWQRWLLIHALERRPDGRFRFRTVVVLVSRQCGKTTLVEVKNLWKMFVLRVPLIIGTAQKLEYAEESWSKAVEIIEGTPELAAEVEHVDYTNGKKALRLTNGSRWKITTASRKGGRSLSGDDVNLDEIREHQTWDAWAAVTKTTMARPDPQIWAITNAGDDKSVVLNDLQEKGRAAAGEPSSADPSLGYFEWSAPEGCDPADEQFWPMAIPALGYSQGVRIDAVRAALGTDPEPVFRCLDVSTPMLTSDGWASMGALSVGEQVKGASGEWVAVVGASPVYYGRPCYRVTLNDGRSVVCDEGHLWAVRDRRRPRAGPETLRTTDLIARGVTYHNPSMNYDVRNFSLPPVAPLDGPAVDLPIHPYLLGLWLGDGSNHAAMVFVEDRDERHVRAVMESCGAVVTTRCMDSGRCWRLGFKTGGKAGHFTGALHELGVHRNKHIPDAYFAASFEQRLWLLRGLMDSDGTVSKRCGRCVFTNTNGKLVAGVRTLVRSLGWKTSDLEPGRYGKDHWLPRFDVGFTPRPDQLAPATIPRKVANIRAARAGHRDVRPITIVSIEPAPSVPVRCIEVDAPDSLFLAGDLVPTHNTECLCQRVPTLTPPALPWAAWVSRGGLDVYDRPSGPVAFAVSASWPDASWTSIGVAGSRDGELLVQVVEHRRGSAWAPARLRELVVDHRPCAVVVDPAGPAGFLVEEIEAELVGLPVELVKPTAREVVHGVGQFYAAICGDEPYARHYDQPELDDAAREAQQRPLEGAWTWARRGSTDIAPLEAVSQASWGLATVKVVDVAANIW